jgi:2-iminobutanoate/2-iminopropanoate deaminase
MSLPILSAARSRPDRRLAESVGTLEEHLRKRVPANAVQHKTAGPYSPVIEIDAGKLVVISGQVAVNLDGDVVGDTIEEQTRLTLENCGRQLASAGASLADVFKVNVYLSDLADWARFNTVYENIMPQPFPARTAVQARLLTSLRVEIEMWAVKPD